MIQDRKLLKLIAIYERMTDADRASLIRYGEACAEENPRRPMLTLVVGGSALGATGERGNAAGKTQYQISA